MTITEIDCAVRALLRKLTDHNHVMRLQDGTLRYLPYRLPAPFGEMISPDVFRAAREFISPTWAPEGCARYRINEFGRIYLAESEKAETV